MSGMFANEPLSEMITFRVTPSQKAALKKITDTTGKGLKDICREGLDLWFEKNVTSAKPAKKGK